MRKKRDSENYINLVNLPQPSSYCVTSPAFLNLINKNVVVKKEGNTGEARREGGNEDSIKYRSRQKRRRCEREKDPEDRK